MLISDDSSRMSQKGITRAELKPPCDGSGVDDDDVGGLRGGQKAGDWSRIAHTEGDGAYETEEDAKGCP